MYLPCLHNRPSREAIAAFPRYDRKECAKGDLPMYLRNDKL